MNLNLERLTSSLTMRAFAGRGLPVSEAEIGNCLNGYWWNEDWPDRPTEDDKPARAQVARVAEAVGTEALVALIRTGGIFVVFGEDATGADDDGFLWGELPRLPFPRLYVEFVDQDGDPCRVTEQDGVEVVGFGIAEIEEGRDWLVVQHAVSEKGIAGIPCRYKSGGVLQDAFGTARAAEIGGSVMLPVICAHLLDARGVKATEVKFPRPQRRRYERAWGKVPPRVYRVEIGGSEESHHPGSSDRTYSCRWLVRGHWRNFDDGRKSWVRPYVKGPKNAPWRGRPVYTNLSKVAA